MKKNTLTALFHHCDKELLIKALLLLDDETQTNIMNIAMEDTKIYTKDSLPTLPDYSIKTILETEKKYNTFIDNIEEIISIMPRKLCSSVAITVKYNTYGYYKTEKEANGDNAFSFSYTYDKNSCPFRGKHPISQNTYVFVIPIDEWLYYVQKYNNVIPGNIVKVDEQEEQGIAWKEIDDKHRIK